MTQESYNLILESLSPVYISYAADNKKAKAVNTRLLNREIKTAADEDTQNILNKIHFQETW